MLCKIKLTDVLKCYLHGEIKKDCCIDIGKCCENFLAVWENSFLFWMLLTYNFVACDCFQAVNDSVARKSARTATRGTGMAVDFVNAEVNITSQY